ncbi:P-loop containing nucleoside triphosphate hydrolase protein [Rhodocollybia butyracea]|uniref:DNA 3'-5' helicase n=1 Tax=Rhodocollybia butyracea TaxID=206335 RepID=A0A9P5U5A9_9AGAR|nr:P-loop containing nucleoside triphosphate hydrolase protein [Rhodocollybia butyracea]
MSLSQDSMAVLSYLKSLNSAQLKAVQHPPQIPLQILAGPGSGKTKVLTSRIAHLILHHKFLPSSICAVTFTNKAANEMKERLTKLIGKEKTAEVRMGTFHALCALFLRKYASSIGLEGNFTVCDAEESKKIITPFLKKYKDDLAAKDITLKEATVLAIISKAKAKGLSASDFHHDIRIRSHAPKNSSDSQISSSTVNDIDLVVAEIYEDYEKTLRKNNSLDFDDLLLFGVKLFTENPTSVKWCRHVLVDEFQDTNVTQYALMEAIAFARCVTVVGDPDQSIYGWRSAEVGNLARMQKDFSSTEQIFLEQNYRSSSSILKASLAIVAQDKTRIQKSLHTSHPVGPIPVLRSFSSEQMEASFLAGEIKRIVAHMGGALNWGDFVVLLRFNALSRTIESALQKEGIPSRVLNGHKFFERLEIKDLLAYLQLVDNPQFVPAFVRAINTPARGIGEKTVSELLARADKSKVTLLDLVEKIHNGKIPDIKPPVRRKLASFVPSIRVLRNLASENTSPSDLIRRLVELIGYEDYLRKTQPDWDTRWENVQELITFASDVQSDLEDNLNLTVTAEAQQQETDVAEAPRETPLRLFLQASMLSSEGDQSKEGENEKVTISTCHSAKGLEWPVVMVPAVEQGTFPFYRTDDAEEERRLLYVACTRAQSLLYLSHATSRKVAGETKTKELSAFVSSVIKEDPTLFFDRPAMFSAPERKVICQVLNRPDPDEGEVTKRITEYNKTSRNRASEYEYDHSQGSSQGPQFMTFTSSGTWNSLNAHHQSSSSHLHSSTTSGPQHRPIPTPQRPHNVSSTFSSSLVPSNTVYSSIPPVSHTPVSHGIHAASTAPKSVIPSARPGIQGIQGIQPLQPIQHIQPTQPSNAALPVVGIKRRLGMGRVTTTGYTNKKFKPPT